MKEYVASVTRRGQVTIPAEIQRLLRLTVPGKVIFAVENHEVRLLAPAFTLESAFGAVGLQRRPEDLESLADEAKQEKAAETVRMLQQREQSPAGATHQ